MSQKLENAKSLYFEGIRDGNAREAVTKYTGARYTQHSTGVRDGVEGFVEFFEPFIKRNPKRDIQIVRGLEDGQYVFVHAYQSLNDGESQWVTTDFFDTDGNDKIIEHWDVIAPYTPQIASGHPKIEGPTAVTDLEKSAANKALVRSLIQDVLIGKNLQDIDTYISSKPCHQENDGVSNGVEEFKSIVSEETNPLCYQEIVLLVGQGNFVATLCKTTWEGDPYAQVDLFRIEDGLVVEHWENAEVVPPEDEWVNSGKF